MKRIPEALKKIWRATRMVSTDSIAGLFVKNTVHTSSHSTVIYHIIMYQTCSVNHLYDLCQPLMLCSKLPGMQNRNVWVRYFKKQMLLENATAATAKETYDKPANSAVALDTRKTNAGLNLFPPAPKICSAADTRTGFSAPTSYSRYIS
jgi:hypothetical protein